VLFLTLLEQNLLKLISGMGWSGVSASLTPTA